VREVDRDTSFLRRHLTEELIRRLDLFQYQRKGNDYVITQVADEQGWREVRDTLIANVGTRPSSASTRRGAARWCRARAHDRDLHPVAERTSRSSTSSTAPVILETVMAANARYWCTTTAVTVKSGSRRPDHRRTV
jgi:hypothetical protein